MTDKRIEELGSIVEEAKQSEEWEAVHMNILEFGMEKEEQNKLREIIGKKLGKGKTVPEIAAALEEPEEVVLALVKEMEPKK